MDFQVNINGANQNWGKGLANEFAWEDASKGEGGVRDAASRLSEIAKFAFGTKSKGENRDGGFGRIGLIDGHVVKFATSRTDRVFVKTTQAMRDSCNALRETLFKLSEEYLEGVAKSSVSGNMFDIKGQLNDIRKKLGMGVNNEGATVIQKGVGLLDRTVVASVLAQLSQVREDAAGGHPNSLHAVQNEGSAIGDAIVKPALYSRVTGMSSIAKAATEAKAKKADEVKASDSVEMTDIEQLKLADFVARLRKHTKITSPDGRQLHDNPFCSDANDADAIKRQLPKTLASFARAESEEEKNAVLKKLMDSMCKVYVAMKYPRDIWIPKFAKLVEKEVVAVH